MCGFIIKAPQKEVAVHDLQETFDNESSQYDEEVNNIIPHYSMALKSACKCLPYSLDASFRMLDVASGTANFDLLVVNIYNNIKIDCLDFSKKMQAIAKKKFKDNKRVQFINTDFFNFSTSEQYDVVFTSFFVHNLREKEEKYIAMKKIADLVKRDGLFIMVDIIVYNNTFKNKSTAEWYRNFLIKNNGADKANNYWIPLLEEEDVPSTITQLSDLGTQVGFKMFDIVYLQDNIAVFLFTK